MSGPDVFLFWTAAGGTPDFNQLEVVSVTEGEPTIGVDFVLPPPPASISGVVRDNAGQPLQNATVQANRTACCGSGSATTNAQGQYTITGLAPGDYTLYAQRTEYVGEYYTSGGGTTDGSAAEAVTLPDGGAVPGIDFSLARLGVITGRVTDTVGNPVVGATVDLWGGCLYSFFASTSTAADGSYSIPSLQPASVYRVRASKSAYTTDFYSSAGSTLNCSQATAVNTGIDATTSDIDIVLARPGSVSGTVRDNTGNPIAGASVSATRTACCGGGSTTSNTLGEYTITGVAPGSYRVYASEVLHVGEYYTSSGGSGDANLAGTVDVSETGAVTGIDFSLITLGGVAGAVRDAAGVAIGGARIYYYGPSCSGCSGATSAADGSYVIHG
ncbi:MAG: carboxypeptidase regulatory-like domain-containing protein, partial [bacterium]